jgi:hypothetical protein
MPYHNHVDPAIVVGAINHLIDEVSDGKTVFYDFYTDAQKQQDPNKRITGLFFFRGNPGAPFAIVCPGGGFSYVGSLHEGFPLALEISKKGYNAFVIRYRIGSEQWATEDLAATIAGMKMRGMDLDLAQEPMPKDGWTCLFNSGKDKCWKVGLMALGPEMVSGDLILTSG